MGRSIGSWVERHLLAPLDGMYARLDRDGEAGFPDPPLAPDPAPPPPPAEHLGCDLTEGKTKVGRPVGVVRGRRG